MNPEVANETFELYYEEGMDYSTFHAMLERGLELIAHHPDATKVVVARMYGTQEANAYKLALQYNEQLMVHLLSEE